MGEVKCRINIHGNVREYVPETTYKQLAKEYQKHFPDDIVLVLVNNRLHGLRPFIRQLLTQRLSGSVHRKNAVKRLLSAITSIPEPAERLFKLLCRVFHGVQIMRIIQADGGLLRTAAAAHLAVDHR